MDTHEISWLKKSHQNFIGSAVHKKTQNPQEAGGLILESAKGTGEAHPCSHDAWKNFWVVVSYMFLMFIPKIGEDSHIFLIFFQMGWFNHQLDF